jgi:hypothetical protein
MTPRDENRQGEQDDEGFDAHNLISSFGLPPARSVPSAAEKGPVAHTFRISFIKYSKLF